MTMAKSSRTVQSTHKNGKNNGISRDWKRNGTEVEKDTADFQQRNIAQGANTRCSPEEIAAWLKELLSIPPRQTTKEEDPGDVYPLTYAQLRLLSVISDWRFFSKSQANVRAVARVLASLWGPPPIDKTASIDWHNVNFSDDGFELAADKRSLGGELGRGTYGVVHRVRHRLTGAQLAVKSIAKASVYAGGLNKQVECEAKVQLSLNHVNILRCFACVEDSTHLHLITEWCSGGDLYGVLRRRPTRRLKESEVFFYFIQLINGLRYVHSQGYSHRDLKIADFGWVAHILGQRNNFNFCGTLDYLSPEMIRGNGHDWRVDIWGVGVLLYELATGKPPFQSTRHYDLTARILARKVDRIACITPDLMTLIEAFLEIDPAKRLTFEQSYSSPWVQRMWRCMYSHMIHSCVAAFAELGAEIMSLSLTSQHDSDNCDDTESPRGPIGTYS